MIRMTYISTAKRGLTDNDVAAILAASRRNNSRDGITGLLLYDGRRFLQALEGEPERVSATYDRITGDGNHRACVELSRAEIGERAFGKWDMAWRRLQPVAEAPTLPQTVDAMVGQVEDRNLQALFTGFARIDRTAA